MTNVLTVADILTITRYSVAVGDILISIAITQNILSVTVGAVNTYYYMKKNIT